MQTSPVSILYNPLLPLSFTLASNSVTTANYASPPKTSTHTFDPPTLHLPCTLTRTILQFPLPSLSPFFASSISTSHVLLPAAHGRNYTFKIFNLHNHVSHGHKRARTSSPLPHISCRAYTSQHIHQAFKLPLGSHISFSFIHSLLTISPPSTSKA